MTKLTRGLLAVAVAGAVVAGACSSDSDRSATARSGDGHDHIQTANAPATGADTLHKDMRKLWEDHVTWTRLFIVSAVAGLPDADATAGRLLQNQADIGNAVATYYGTEAGTALTELLREHILVAADLVAAAKAGDQPRVADRQAAWYANGDEIAAFLARANRAWPLETLTTMMRGHLDQTLAEATARLRGDWATDIAEYDHIHTHILTMADALSDGIVAQFPDRFTH